MFAFNKIQISKEAVKQLEKAFEHGFDDIEDLDKNKFFKPIRQQSKFKAFLEVYRKQR